MVDNLYSALKDVHKNNLDTLAAHLINLLKVDGKTAPANSATSAATTSTVATADTAATHETSTSGSKPRSVKGKAQWLKDEGLWNREVFNTYKTDHPDYAEIMTKFEIEYAKAKAKAKAAKDAKKAAERAAAKVAKATA